MKHMDESMYYLRRRMWHLHRPTTDSTLLDLRRPPLCDRREPILLATADYQTAGRGQRGTSWESAPALNLLFALGLRHTAMPADRQFRLSQAMALAVADALSDLLPAQTVCVKWPNDIFVGESKICGMLLEHDVCGEHISATRIGVGVNVNQRRFFGDAPRPVSLYQLTGREADREALLGTLLDGFLTRCDRLAHDGGAELHAEYCRRLYRGTGVYPWRDAVGTFSARIVAIGADGRLTLEDTAGRQRRYAFKEVAFVH